MDVRSGYWWCHWFYTLIWCKISRVVVKWWISPVEAILWAVSILASSPPTPGSWPNLDCCPSHPNCSRGHLGQSHHHVCSHHSDSNNRTLQICSCHFLPSFRAAQETRWLVFKLSNFLSFLKSLTTESWRLGRSNTQPWSAEEKVTIISLIIFIIVCNLYEECIASCFQHYTPLTGANSVRIMV